MLQGADRIEAEIPSWSTFDIHSFDAEPEAFAGAAFDGRYVYFVPEGVPIVTRYDTQAPFAAPGSWTKFDARSLLPTAASYTGAVFDGQYLYVVPKTAVSFVSPTVLRFQARSAPAPLGPPWYGGSSY